MKFGVISIIVFITCSSAFAAIDPSPTDGNALLVGKWTWVRPTNNCTEVYEYHTDGTMFVSSGDEKSENTYHLSAQPSTNGFYTLSTTIVKDYGGKDCADSDTIDTGASNSSYLKFNPTTNQYILCGEESFEHCMGPLQRIGN